MFDDGQFWKALTALIPIQVRAVVSYVCRLTTCIHVVLQLYVIRKEVVI